MLISKKIQSKVSEGCYCDGNYGRYVRPRNSCNGYDVWSSCDDADPDTFNSYVANGAYWAFRNLEIIMVSEMHC